MQDFLISANRDAVREGQSRRLEAWLAERKAAERKESGFGPVVPQQAEP